MRCLLLAEVIPFCVFSALASERMEGEIALSAPQCTLFVVQTGPGFSLLREDGYRTRRRSGSGTAPCPRLTRRRDRRRGHIGV